MKNLLFSLILTSMPALADIRELPTYKGFDLNQITPDTLVIFDIDNTLIRQNHMIGTHQWGDYMKKRAVAKGVPDKEASHYQHEVFAEVQPYAEVVLVEKEVHRILNYLKKNNLPHFALTARPSKLMDTTVQQLSVLKHDFNRGFPAQIDPSLLKDYLKEGLIFSGSTPKGELLKTIIANSKVKPNKIIFFDDREYNLKSVEQSFTGGDIEMISYRYGAADPFVNNFDSSIADIEYSFFHEFKVILDDKIATDLRQDLDSVVNLRFNYYLMEQGPLVDDLGECIDISPRSQAEKIFRCDYLYDGTPASIDFSFLKTSTSIEFGNW